MIHRIAKLLVLLLLIGAASGLLVATTVDNVIAPVRKLSSCQPIEGEEPPVSLQAGMLYHYDTENGEPVLRPLSKRFESFRCGRRTATIYLYEYRDDTAARGALSAATVLIWGGDKPSSRHPEAVFTVENILVVVSAKNPRELADAILGRSKEDKH